MTTGRGAEGARAAQGTGPDDGARVAVLVHPPATGRGAADDPFPAFREWESEADRIACRDLAAPRRE